MIQPWIQIHMSLHITISRNMAVMAVDAHTQRAVKWRVKFNVPLTISRDTLSVTH